MRCLMRLAATPSRSDANPCANPSVWRTSILSTSIHSQLRPADYNAQKVTPRLTGRRAVAQRLRRLRAEPLCRDCAPQGIVTAVEVVDHIVPLALGDDDSDANTIIYALPAIISAPPSSSGCAGRCGSGLTSGQPTDRTPWGASQSLAVSGRKARLAQTFNARKLATGGSGRNSDGKPSI